MTAIPSPSAFAERITPVSVRASSRALSQMAVIDYCTVSATDQTHETLRDLTPLEAMYAYYGSDEA